MDGLAWLLKDMKPMPPEVKAAYQGTEFSCECGGLVIPQTMEDGICFSCKAILKLAECEYEEDTDGT